MTTHKDLSAIQANLTTIRELSDVPASFRIAALMLLRAERGSLHFVLPDGRAVVFDHGLPGPAATVHIHSYDMTKKAMAGGDVGFAESFMDGDWTTPDLTAVLEFFSENFPDICFDNLYGQIRHGFPQFLRIRVFT